METGIFHYVNVMFKCNHVYSLHIIYNCLEEVYNKIFFTKCSSLLVNTFSDSYLQLVCKFKCHYSVITDTNIGACAYINWKPWDHTIYKNGCSVPSARGVLKGSMMKHLPLA